jgi:thioredoxin reductase (NADPH)
MHSSKYCRMVKIIKFYGTPWCSDCKRTKVFLGEQRIPYENAWVNIDEDEDGALKVEALNDGKRKVPTIIFDDGSMLIEPSNAQLANKLGIRKDLGHEFHDVIIVGGGPSGLTAALYAARDGLDAVVIEKSSLGGQASFTQNIDNYPGFPEGISGAELSDKIVEQCRKFGVEFLLATEVTSIHQENEYFVVRTSSGDEITSTALLLATGSKYRKLGVPGEDELIGYKLHFCSTCDGPFYKNREVAVIGGGNSAFEESIFLARFASKVSVYGRSKDWKASKVLLQKVSEEPKIHLINNTEVVEILVGDKKSLDGLKLRNNETGDIVIANPTGVFVFVGLEPNNELIRDLVEIDERGFIITGNNLMTSLDGVFASGDVRAGSTKQAVSAMGEGAGAAIHIRDYLRIK